jgi:GGDEF domain-containing protein
MSYPEAAHLIPTRKGSDELDRLEETGKAAKAGYTNAVWATAQYTVELDAADTKRFREHLEQIRAEVEKAASPEDWRSIQASFRGELRQHRDDSLKQLTHLRAELKAAADTMHAFMNSIAVSGADHEEDLQEALRRLDAAAQSDNLAAIRSAINEATQAIGASVERMQRSHQIVIAQLQDEIRLLHQQMENNRRALLIDDSTGVWNRQKLDSAMDALSADDEPFCLLVVRIRALTRPDQGHSPGVIEAAVKALLQRLSTMLGDDAILGRWDTDTFAAILKTDAETAAPLSRDVAQKLSGVYPVQENGVSRSIELQAVAGVLERGPGAEGPALQQKLVQLSAALSNA